MEMKKKSLLILITIILAFIGLGILADYNTLENQILRDIDKYYENGKDPEIGEEIIGKIARMGANSQERLSSYLEKNPKVNEFLIEWAKTHN